MKWKDAWEVLRERKVAVDPMRLGILMQRSGMAKKRAVRKKRRS